MNKLALLFLSIGIMLHISANGQTYLGISSNIGNQLSFSPSSDGLKRPVAVSGNLFLMKQEKLNSNWLIQYGVEMGILGYNLKIITQDTIHIHDITNFWDYSTFYGGLDLLVGKEFLFRDKPLMVGIGGGLTYYYFTYPTQYTISAVSDNFLLDDLFFADVDIASQQISGYVRITSQLKLNEVLSLGLSYSYHFSPALSGSYEFFHTAEPSYGDIHVYQRELKLSFLVRVSKK